MIKNTSKGNSIGLFIGAGFDRAICLPAWDELINSYTSYLEGNINKEREKGLEKLNIIKHTNLSTTRKYGLLRNVANKHISDIEKRKYEFEEVVFNIESYKKENYDVIKDILEEIKKYINIRIITTNVSNTLERSGFKAVEKGGKLQSTINFYPIHGLINSSELLFLHPVLEEKEYIRQDYAEFKRIIDTFDEIHIFGYSLNDFEILKNLNLYSSQIIYFYHLYEDEVWKEMLEEYFSPIFNNKVNFVSYKTDWSPNENNKLFDLLKTNLSNNAVKFSDITDIEDLLGGKDE